MSASGISGHSSIDFEPDHVTEKTFIVQNLDGQETNNHLSNQQFSNQNTENKQTPNQQIPDSNLVNYVSEKLSGVITPSNNQEEWTAEDTGKAWIIVLSIILAVLVIIVALIITSLVTERPVSVCCSTSVSNYNVGWNTMFSQNSEFLYKGHQNSILRNLLSCIGLGSQRGRRRAPSDDYLEDSSPFTLPPGSTGPEFSRTESIINMLGEEMTDAMMFDDRESFRLTKYWIFFMEKFRYLGDIASENGTSLRFFTFSSNSRENDISSEEEKEDESCCEIEVEHLVDQGGRLETEETEKIENLVDNNKVRQRILSDDEMRESLTFWDDVCMIESHVHKEEKRSGDGDSGGKERRRSSFIGDSSENWA